MFMLSLPERNKVAIPVVAVPSRRLIKEPVELFDVAETDWLLCFRLAGGKSSIASSQISASSELDSGWPQQVWFGVVPACHALASQHISRPTVALLSLPLLLAFLTGCNIHLLLVPPLLLLKLSLDRQTIPGSLLGHLVRQLGWLCSASCENNEHAIEQLRSPDTLLKSH